ncbi:MAG: HAD family phosphatase [Alphaproteobacteria bacterium]|nr:HAD family phosphatase [Alphaproteobacteria bacterium]
MSEPVEALLFDLGNVILKIDFQRTTTRWAEHAGCDPKALWKRYSPDEAYKKHERGLIDDAGYFAALRTMLEIDISDEQFLDGWNATFGGPIAGVEEWLAPACAALPSCVFSNTNPAHELYFRANYAELLKPFRTVFTSSGIGHRKPDREAFDYVAQQMGVAPGRILFFDDALANVEGARAAGLQAVHVRSNDDVMAALRPLVPGV